MKLHIAVIIPKDELTFLRPDKLGLFSLSQDALIGKIKKCYESYHKPEDGWSSFEEFVNDEDTKCRWRFLDWFTIDLTSLLGNTFGAGIMFGLIIFGFFCL